VTKLAADVRNDLMQFSMGMVSTINREDILDLCDQFDAVTTENERLRAENERLRGECDTWKATAVQADGLRYEAANALNAALGQNERFAAELTKLRTLIDTHNDECRECPVIA
jgi:hypothetical protein